jgi:deoxyribonuclease (pyrimidine dimer)
MTRINLINPKDLADQHLIAEYRELPRIFWAVRKKLQQNKKITVWEKYKMWTWHVIFFYDKLWFLEKRYNEIIKECKERNFNIKFENIDISDIPSIYKKDFKPSEIDKKISLERIQEKLSSKPWFYKKYWKIIN